MNRPYRQTDFEEETENFEAFDQLTTALTLIDSFQSAEYKDKELLNRATTSINEALKADENYFKAKYFQAVVKYLRGENAVEEFSSLLKRTSSDDVRNEIEYNRAVVNSHLGNFEKAIAGFQTVADGSADPETKLLARAGQALTYANRIKDSKHKNDKETQDKVRNEIKRRQREIERTLTSTQGKLISADVKKEIYGILEEALTENVKLPRRRRRKRAQDFRRVKLILFIALILILLLLIPYFYLYRGLHTIFGP